MDDRDTLMVGDRVTVNGAPGVIVGTSFACVTFQGAPARRAIVRLDDGRKVQATRGQTKREVPRA